MQTFPTLLPGLASHPYAYPLLEVVHIVGIAALLGNLLLFELRWWGLVGPALPLESLARVALGLAAGGFVLAAGSGLLMFASQPAELLANRTFVVKMGLLMGVGLNAALFHARDGLRRRDALAHAQTVLSLGAWLAVVVCGRWIAYS